MMRDAGDRVPTPGKTALSWIWDGVEAAVDQVGRMQPPWEIPRCVAVKVDVGHHHQAPDVVREATESIRASACAVHLHIRDGSGQETGDVAVWQDVLARIRTVLPDVVVDSSPRGKTFAEQQSFVAARLADIVPILPTWDREYLAAILRGIDAAGAKPEIDCWDGTDIAIIKSLYVDTGLIRPPTSWLLVPSSPYYGLPMPNPMLMARGLMHMIELIKTADASAVVTVAASGRASSYLTAMSTILGCHIRPGMGETHWRHPHTSEPILRNETVVADAVAVARALGREPATPAEYRQMLGLPAATAATSPPPFPPPA